MTAASVLHVIPAVAPRYGGPSAAVIGMCQALRQIGVSTLVLTTDADGPGRLDVLDGEVDDYQGVPTIFFARQASEAYKWSRPLAAWVKRHIRTFDIAHIHAVFSHSSVAAARACLNAGVPYILRPLGTLDPWSLHHHGWRKQLLIRFGAGRLLAGAATIHYTTGEEKRLAEQQMPWLPPGTVIPLGVDDEHFAGTTHTNASPYILALSRLDPKKGIDVLIQAFHLMAQAGQGAGCRLVIAGDGDPAYVAKLREVAAAGEARARIVFEGWVSGDARLSLLRHAALFALPSSQENFGIALVEAMACGTPAVVSRGVNLAPDIDAAQAGWIVPREPAELAGALGRILGDRAALIERRARARGFAAAYRWSVVADSLVKMYQGILAGRASAHNHLRRVADGTYRAAPGAGVDS